ncbi:MAG: hypothetical protein H7Y00_15200, partial [Fimbriimonadaceae bacterium]|nr:hypothetical protein [Chitinophagales bacterium]
MNTLKQNKLLNYSALAGTFLFIADKSNAQIVYTDLDPDHAGTYIFDFNDDGTNEMYLDENFNILSYGSGTYVGTAQINLRNIGAGSVQAVVGPDVAILNSGYTIGSGANIDSAYYVVDCAFGT